MQVSYFAGDRRSLVATSRRRQWGGQSALYANRVLGDFHAEDEDSTIPLAWVEAAVERWHAWDEYGCGDLGGPHTVGVDVARLGDDKTVLAVRHGPVLVELRRFVKEDTMQTTGRVTGVLHGDLQSTAIVDVIGVGAGVVDRLWEQKQRVRVTAAASARTTECGTAWSCRRAMVHGENSQGHGARPLGAARACRQ